MKLGTQRPLFGLTASIAVVIAKARFLWVGKTIDPYGNVAFIKIQIRSCVGPRNRLLGSGGDVYE